MKISDLSRENDLATLALDICFKIHRQYGPGLFESVYEAVFYHEISKSCLLVEKQKPIPLIHENLELDTCFRADFILENCLLLEFKSVEALAKVHFKQVQTYLKLSQISLGLLINFNCAFLREGIRRIVYSS